MPKPRAPKVAMPPRTGQTLERWVHRYTGPQHRAQRAKILLMAADGVPNIHIADKLNLHRDTVGKWRTRFVDVQDKLAEMEAADVEDRELESALESVVDDAPRPGGPPKFEPEAVVSIVQLACTEPADFDLPISHWTPKALARQAEEENIVESISPSSVRRFLKRS